MKKLINTLIISSILILSSCSEPNEVNNVNPNNNIENTNNSTDKSNSSNESNSNSDNKQVNVTVSTIAGDSNGNIQNKDFTNLKFKNINEVRNDNNGNSYILDTNNIYRITNNNNVNPLKVVEKKEVYNIPNVTFEFKTFYIEDNNNVYNIYLPSTSKELIKIKVRENEVIDTEKIPLKNTLDLGSMTGMVFDSKGNIFITDSIRSKIIKINSDKEVSLFAGGGNSGIEKGLSNGKGKNAIFNFPSKLVVDKNDNIFITDTKNHCIRKMTPDGEVTVFAGNGKNGFKDGKAFDALFNSPEGITIDNNDNLYIADTENHLIRKIDKSGNVTTIAGNRLGFNDGKGSDALFYKPNSISFHNNTLFVGDSKNLRIRKIELN